MAKLLHRADTERPFIGGDLVHDSYLLRQSEKVTLHKSIMQTLNHHVTKLDASLGQASLGQASSISLLGTDLALMPLQNVLLV